MTITDYVTVNTAKLLKEAGFPQSHELSYGKVLVATEDGPLSRPSLWDAMKWLREEKKLFIEITLWADMFGIGLFSPDCPTDNMLPWSVSSTRFPTYEQACEAGIAAACEYLLTTQMS